MLLVDIQFGVRTPDLVAIPHENYVKKLKRRLAWAYNKAKDVTLKMQQQYKRYHDRKIRCTKIEVGDTVLVRQKAFKGKHKIQDRWELSHYKVLEQPNEDIPVFKVQDEKTSKVHILHRNMLFPLIQDVQSEYALGGDGDKLDNEEKSKTKTTNKVLKETGLKRADPLYKGPITRS